MLAAALAYQYTTVDLTAFGSDRLVKRMEAEGWTLICWTETERLYRRPA